MQAAGWAIVIGFGAFFALFASVLVYIDIAFSGEVRSVDMLTDTPHSETSALMQFSAMICRSTTASTLTQQAAL